MNLKELQENRIKLKDEIENTNSKIQEYINKYKFTGKEILSELGNEEDEWGGSLRSRLFNKMLDLIIKKEEEKDK